MIGNIFKVLISVKAKLFFGFFAMTLIIMLLGGYAFVSIGGAGSVVKDTFDRPLMAINFARSASQVFSEVEIELLTQLSQRGADAGVDYEALEPYLTRFKEDLSIAKERSISSDAASFFDDTDESLKEWEALIAASTEGFGADAMQRAQSIADTIEEQLDIIVELQANESFRAREKSIAQMDKIKRYNLWAVSVALAVTLILSFWIAVTIIRPLKAAATAAQKISAGNFNVNIPKGGDDETGVLLKTMAAMQENIRSRMERETDSRALAQHRLADSLENSKDGILLTDKDNKIIVANPQLGLMFPPLAGLNLVTRPYAEFFQSSGCPLTGANHFDVEKNQIQFEDGRWLRVAASDTREGGQLFIWSDITEAKERSQRLREARDEAEAADKAKTLFLAAMSHELRTPLNAVIGFSDILKASHNGPNGNPKHAEMAGLISKSGAQLLNIVKDVLSVAKGTDTGKLSMEMASVDVVDVVTFCMKTMAGEAAERGINLIWTPPQNAFWVEGDVLRLQQLLLNLLSNAITYNQAGGAVKVQLNYYKDGSVRLDVIDNGIGIEKSDIGRIMEPFVQVDDGFTRKYDGVGLGLTIVNQILSSHDGKIAINSKIGEGTVVTVVLPVLTDSQSGLDKKSA